MNLNAIFAQMASTQVTQPMSPVFNRQTSDGQPSLLPSCHGDVFAFESASSQNGKYFLTSASTTRQPTKRTSKSIIKQVVTADGEESVSCEPFSSLTEVKKGQRVIVSRTISTEYGTVRAVNVTIDVNMKGFIGVEMDLPSMCMMHKKCVVMLFSTGGVTDGQVKGIRHFKWLVILVDHIKNNFSELM